MKKCLFIFVLLLTYGMGHAQFGLTAGWQSFDAEEWEEGEYAFDTRIAASINSGTFSSNYYVGLDYWFRLKNKRIEFLPELSYNQSKLEIGTINTEPNPRTYTYTANTFSFFLNTNIYPFDFAGDCDCPTFSKDGDLLKKGFFIRLAPGVSMINQDYLLDYYGVNPLPDQSTQNSEIVFAIRGGLGLDIGVSDFFTITPMIMATYYPNVVWSDLVSDQPIDPPVIEVESTILNLFGGIRLGFRFDELNKYGYR